MDRTPGRADALTQSFLEALRAGRACLHPTDTLPGLAFDPLHPTGREAVARFKGRDAAQPFLGLVASVEQAVRYFMPLPRGWTELLDQLWPGPLSVIWTASGAAPEAMVSGDGSIGLRVPRLPREAAWFLDVVSACRFPLPTTSVNESGKPPIVDWRAAASFVESREQGWVPSLPDARMPRYEQAQASTVVKLQADGGFVIVRAGAMPAAKVERAWEEIVSNDA